MCAMAHGLAGGPLGGPTPAFLDLASKDGYRSEIEKRHTFTTQLVFKSLVGKGAYIV
jgi:hypothetical protein